MRHALCLAGDTTAGQLSAVRSPHRYHALLESSLYHNFAATSCDITLTTAAGSRAGPIRLVHNGLSKPVIQCDSGSVTGLLIYYGFIYAAMY